MKDLFDEEEDPPPRYDTKYEAKHREVGKGWRGLKIVPGQGLVESGLTEGGKRGLVECVEEGLL